MEGGFDSCFLLVLIIISLDFDAFSFKLFSYAHRLTLSSSFILVSVLDAGTIKMTSSAYLFVWLPWQTACRSEAQTRNEAGPTADP